MRGREGKLRAARGRLLASRGAGTRIGGSLLAVLAVAVGFTASSLAQGSFYVEITNAPPSPTSETSATFTFRAHSAPAEVSFTCVLDGGRPQPCSSPQTYTDLSPGDHTFTVTGRAGRLSDSDSHNWTIFASQPDPGPQPEPTPPGWPPGCPPPSPYIEARAAIGVGGTDGDDTLIGSDCPEFFFAHDGNDTVYALGEEDDVIGGRGRDKVWGGDGDDRLHGYVFGGEGFAKHGDNDVVAGEAGDDWLTGGPDDDTLYGGPGNDGLNGGNGDDRVRGGEGNDKIRGDATHHGQRGIDKLYGEAGDDHLSSGRTYNKNSRPEKLYGGDGDDRLVGGKYRDALRGGAGADTAFGRGGVKDTDNISGGDGPDELHGEGGRDTVSGGEGADRVWGESGDDDLHGGPGRDVLYGGAGDDRIRARDGKRDTIKCGKGRDTVHADPHDVLSGCEVLDRSR